MRIIGGLYDGKEGGKCLLYGKLMKKNKDEILAMLATGKELKFLVFKNDRREKDTHPHYNLCLAEVEANGVVNNDDAVPF